MEPWHCSPSAATIPQLALDPYRFPGADIMEPTPCDVPPRDVPPQKPGEEHKAPLLGEENPRAHQQPSDPRHPRSLHASDRRRLDLHAALTTVGIPPLPGDLAAIHTLSALDDTTNAALVRWITARR
ncbi:hypothetical protein OG373_33290 [Streptomyces avidinii]|uniref:hypothetical protein n=1 Tax=Streptomyces avidinii TaxID=1895 RepID=UPI003868B713|nr:hypothetical protein OG373_33290 [Streptomyces avidinii]